MSGAFPTSVVPNSIPMTSIAPTVASIAHSLKSQVRSRAVQRWGFEVDFPPMTRAQFMPLYAFAVKQRGSYETFTFIPHTLITPQGTATGTPVVSGASQTGRKVNTSGWTSKHTGLLKAGEQIKIPNRNKV